ncbi:uncharacterized protein EDB91DRAFT_1105457 [Suillus paluster]|uniref:uncharacterized protein n=1 Tax=Suillus paluster TaxID=48578 RepID=UPI001B87816E|nr:uncharacterized protein EDB91DRAFT_1105457 [Suillus paluster]KAG1751424.1 hypothetical protein EDB91DRAFT_1105457 [Suillus paluster]
MAANFSSVPVLDFALVSDDATKSDFILQLRHALINVGFLYLNNHTVSQKITNDLIDYIPRLFELPQEAKNKIFYGKFTTLPWFTKGKTDYREQFDFATPHETQWKPGAPEHLRLWGPSQVVKYPANDGSLTDQGVQNLSGQWIDVPPIPGTFVVNIGKALEFVTRGLARATSHRVLSPPVDSTPRYSILQLKQLRGDPVQTDSVNFSEFDREASGKVNLIGRVKSHPDVAQRHYPDLFKQYFPKGVPNQVSAY